MMNFRTNVTVKVFTLKALNPPHPGHKTKQMSDLKMSAPQGNDDKEFEAHPEGTFMAVCRDVFVKEEPNPWYGKSFEEGEEPDMRKTLRRVIFEFLTDEPIELKGQMYPRYVRHKLNLSWGDKSKLRPFVTAWCPAIGKDDHGDLEGLVGQGAYLTISHNTDKQGRVWANIVGIAAPPKGASFPAVPANFVRHKDKAAPAVTDNPQATYEAPKQGIGQTADDLPF